MLIRPTFSLQALAFLSCCSANAVLADESQRLSPEGLQGADFGFALAADDPWLAIGVPGTGDGTGSVYLYFCDETGCAESMQIQSPDPDDRSSFGAAIALDGDLLAIASPERGRGEVDIFNLSSGSAVHDTVLTAFEGGGNARFGSSLDLDGLRLVVGTPAADDERGAAYVFNRNGAGWTQSQRLLPASRQLLERFGHAVALSGDEIWIGAPLHDPDGAGPGYARGAVTVFNLTAGTFSPSQTLELSNATDGDLFGWTLALDDQLGVIGAPGRSSRQGETAVMQQQISQWVEVQRLSSVAPRPGNRFGWSVAIEGTEIVVGEAFAGVDSDARCGSAQQFSLDAGSWTGQGLDVRSVSRSGLLGWSIQLTPEAVVIAAPTASSSGQVVRFDRVLSIFSDGLEGGESGCRSASP